MGDEYGRRIESDAEMAKIRFCVLYRVPYNDTSEWCPRMAPYRGCRKGISMATAVSISTFFLITE